MRHCSSASGTSGSGRMSCSATSARRPPRLGDSSRASRSSFPETRRWLMSSRRLAAMENPGSPSMRSQSATPSTQWNRARFYTIHGRQLPSVTTILDVLARPGARDPEFVLSAVAEAVTGVKAADRERQKAAAIGTAIHAGIEWHLRTRLGEDAGLEPRLPEAAVWAVESWKDWARSVDLQPLAIERAVYCELCGYAGTLDLYARVTGVLSVIDWKSGKAIYPEAFLQSVAYRHAAERLGLPSEQGLIVRLPKLIEDPAWEVMTVPETVTLADFLAAGNLWRWQRRMDGQPEGDRLAPRPSGVHPVPAEPFGGGLPGL